MITGACYSQFVILTSVQSLFKSDGEQLSTVACACVLDLTAATVAKKYYELSNKDLEALPFYQFACSRKRIIPLAAILAHVQRRLEATGIPYPKLKPEYTVKSHRHVKHLTSHCSIMENLKIMKAHFEGK